MNIIVYDLEILQAIPDKRNTPLPDITYCQGWGDHAGMGISVLGAYDTESDRYRVICNDNKGAAQELFFNPSALFVSFNGIGFDNKVLDAYWGIMVPESQCFDLLVEIWAAHGLGPKFSPRTHGGFGLDAMCAANGIGAKSGKGAYAPIDWQRGLYGKVIDYCLGDVWLTNKLFKLSQECQLASPKDGTLFRIRTCQNSTD